MRPTLVATATLCGLSFLSSFAYADSITQTAVASSEAAGGFYGTADPLSITGFNSSLGTLTQVDLSFTGTILFTPFAGAYADDYVYLLDPSGGDVTVLSAQSNDPGGALISAQGSFTDPALLADVIADPDPFVFQTFAGAPNGASNGYVTATYDYVPSSVTPEPSSIALLGTGLLGIAGVIRKRFA